ncbi:hypothetical protein HK104_003036 [Borealophlyctis nickersoniae]|nr:hypothetical protein HK104_003036 [Borealophlyctis nickersoniae]
MKLRGLVLLLGCLLSTSTVHAAPTRRQSNDTIATLLAGSDYTNQKLVRLQAAPGTLSKIHRILEEDLSLDVWDTQKDHIDFRILTGLESVVLNTASLKNVAGGKVSITVLEDNLQKLVDEEKARLNGPQVQAADWFADYHRYADIRTWYQTLSTQYPDLVTFVPSIGKSVEGRDIFAVRITNKASTGAKKQYWFQGLQHAREWIGGATVQYVSQQLLVEHAATPGRLNGAEFIIVPVVNPDGYEYTWTSSRLWRKNRASPSGVDLNRNWDDHWGQGGSSSSPSSDTYRGPYAASEPEVQALAKYFLSPSNKNLIGAIDFHSYSQLVLRPYGWTETNAPDERLNKLAGDGIRDQIRSTSGKGYTSEKSIELYVTTGSAQDFWYSTKVNTFLSDHRLYSFTIELRPSGSASQGFILPPAEIKPTGQEVWAALKWWIGFTQANPLKA